MFRNLKKGKFKQILAAIHVHEYFVLRTKYFKPENRHFRWAYPLRMGGFHLTHYKTRRFEIQEIFVINCFISE